MRRKKPALRAAGLSSGAVLEANSLRGDAQVAAYQLFSVLGWLTARKLTLRVQLYDPSLNYKDNATRWFGFGD